VENEIKRNFQKSLNSLNHESEDRIQQKQEKKNRKKQKKNIYVEKICLRPKLLVQIPEKILLKF
jgi:hypothetical protein